MRTLSEDLRNPNLFEENPQGQYVYVETINESKVAFGSLQLVDYRERNAKEQLEAGGDARRGKDHESGPDDGGHLIGARFGGDPGAINLTAQSRNLNRQDYKSMEDEWAKHLDNGDKVFVYIETDAADRPNVYMGYVIYEYPDGTRSSEYIHMVNESRKEIASWQETQDEFERAEAEKNAALGIEPQDEYPDYLSEEERAELNKFLDEEYEAEQKAAKGRGKAAEKGNSEEKTEKETEKETAATYEGDEETEAVTEEEDLASVYEGDEETEAVTEEEDLAAVYEGDEETETVTEEEDLASVYEGGTETVTAEEDLASTYEGGAETEATAGEDLAASYEGGSTQESTSSVTSSASASYDAGSASNDSGGASSDSSMSYD